MGFWVSETVMHFVVNFVQTAVMSSPSSLDTKIPNIKDRVENMIVI